jgi:hypothetical protein
MNKHHELLSYIGEKFSLMYEMPEKIGQIKENFSVIYLKNMKIGLLSILNGSIFPYFPLPS